MIANKVMDALKDQGVETPLTDLVVPDKKDEIERSVRIILLALGLNLSDDSLSDTPKRVAKMFVDEIFRGLNYANFPKITTIENKWNYGSAISVNDISLNSTCEHHLVTISGQCHVSYIPNKKVIGLSKINRIVQFFAQRPQVQERLTKQIQVALQTILETDDVMVIIKAKHFCVAARGIKDTASYTITSTGEGVFSGNSYERKEIMEGIK